MNEEKYIRGPYKPTESTEDLSVQERLDIFIKSKGLGRYQFERRVGLPQSYVANVRQAPHPQKVKMISDAFPELNIEWLITGKGDMIKQGSDNYSRIVEALIQQKEELIQGLREQQERYIRLEEIHRTLLEEIRQTLTELKINS